MTLELEPIDPPTLMVVLSMTAPRWSHKARVVAMIGAFHGGAWIAARDIAEAVNRDERRCNTLLNELAEERVISRSFHDGRRPGWCEVNPDVRAWRKVAWVFDADVVEAKVALFERRRRATSTALERLIARPIGARQEKLVARLIGAGLAPFWVFEDARQDPLSRGNGTRDNAEGVDAHRAAMARAATIASRAAMGRATTNGRSPTAVLNGFGDDSTVVGNGNGPAFGEPTAAETVTVDEGALTAMRRAILERTVPDDRGRHFINGKPLVALTELVVRYRLDELLATLERGPVGELVPGLIGWLADHVGREPCLDPDDAPAVDVGRALMVRASILEGRIVALRRQADQCDAEGATPAGDTYREELAECETELAGVLSQLTGEDQ